MDGLQFAQKFKAKNYDKKPIIIIYSARTDKCSASLALKSGVNICIQKPISLKDLQSILEKIRII